MAIMASTYPQDLSRDVASAREAVTPPRPRSRMTRLFPLLSRGRWYAARLAAMPPREVPHRIAQARRCMMWRRDIAGWLAFDAIGDGPLADLAPLRARLSRSVGLGADDPSRISRWRTFDGQFGFLGFDWPPVAAEQGQTLQIPSLFWFHDPITGKSWPDEETSSFDIDVRSTGAQIGDVKYVWEPNRLQMLHPLAAAMAATQDRTARQIAFSVLESWAAANPPYRGVNWVSGIELALRLVSIMLVVAAAEPSTLSFGERILIRRLVVAHARYLAAFPSLYSSANNHRVAEGLGLFIAGALLPDLDEAAGWLDDGRPFSKAESVRQILADGVGAEQSLTYQAFTMEMLALAARLAVDLRAPLDASVTERPGARRRISLVARGRQRPRAGDRRRRRRPRDRAAAGPRAALRRLGHRRSRGPHGASDLAPAARDPHLRDAIFDSPVTPAAERTGVRISERGGITVANTSL